MIQCNNTTINDAINKRLISIKISFEDEGLDFTDCLFMKSYCDKYNIKLYLKLGGAEAIRDIKDANKLGITKIIAPMIESDFALEKYVKAAESHYTVQDGGLGLNIESITGYRNLKTMFDNKFSNSLDSITIGRGDLAESLCLNRYDGGVDSKQIYELCIDILNQAKAKGLSTYIGGSMSAKSEQFCLSLIENNLLDNFETRNVIFHRDTLKYYTFSDLIKGAKELEYNFLIAKQKYYTQLANQDLKRINQSLNS